MKLEEEILMNKYGQELISNEALLNNFTVLSLKEKREFLNEMMFLIIQSKPNNNDIENIISDSKLKPTYTPCILLKKGISSNNLNKIIALPETELNKAFLLFLSLFKIPYQSRFKIEKNNPDKWWYWDLSDEKKVNEIKNRSILN